MTEDVRVNLADAIDFYDVLIDLIDKSSSEISNILPSNWVEQNIVLPSELSSVTGKFKYSNTPHTLELADLWHPSSEIREVVIMKSAQSAITKSVVLAPMMWSIENDPGPTMLLVGHNELVQAAGTDLDAMIDGADIRSMIQTNSQRLRKTKSGDKNTFKEFAGGWISLGLTNPDSLRQVAIKNLVVDDYDAMDSETKKDGDIDTVFNMRQNAYANSRMLWKISTPTVKGQSNIERDYLKGDQRKWNIPAPCCNEYIVLSWSVEMEGKPKERGGIVWEVDDLGHLIPESVGYKCQKCGEVFDDSDKMSWLNAGQWVPTAKSTRPDLRSYHFNALASPTFMHGWKFYVYQWLDYLNADESKQQPKLQSFTNLVLGEPFEFKRKTGDASKLQNNIRKFQIGTIPEKLSIADGNGPIVMVTCAMDLGGTVDDCRIDWEVKAYAAGGQSYSIDQGSFGSFIPRDKEPEKRDDKKTYAHGSFNSVWSEVQHLIHRKFLNDNTERLTPIFLSGIDTGYFTDYAYTFIDLHPKKVVALKGLDDSESMVRESSDYVTFQRGKSRTNLYMVRTNYTKDIILSHMELQWSKELHSQQPFGFMNFPIPSDGKYLKTSFFDHYESEERAEVKGKYKWVKKHSNVQNHFWDVVVYNEVVKDIFVDKLFRKAKIVNGTWDDYVAIIRKSMKQKKP